jgi:CRP/FNR family transcriptional regulator, polysaccharide utilization system transcription regulator
MQYINPFIELCLEGSSSIFKGLNQKDKETLSGSHTHSVLKKGQFLFQEGEKPHGLICLVSGKAKVFKEGVGGRGQILKMVRQQGVIGYKMLFSDGPWPFSAMAIEDSAICTLEKHAIIRLLKKNSDLSLKFLRVVSEELYISNNRLVSLTQKHIRGRLAESLLILRDTYGYEADGTTIRAVMSREDIANLSNMTTSNAIRTLSGLAEERIINIRGRRISILDDSQLEHISELG